MAKTCAVTGKSSLVAGGYSNKTRATKYNPTGKVRRHANLQKKKIFVPEIDKTFNLTLSANAIKTINRHGAFKVLKKAGIIKPTQPKPAKAAEAEKEA
ncbi:MAG: 50S ribosomal protein L28 [Candidatus Nomurabacteria bacterium]|nr:50S ribosomal protein L28 [Candidatus Nomurabacteria bacterium]